MSSILNYISPEFKEVPNKFVFYFFLFCVANPVAAIVAYGISHNIMKYLTTSWMSPLSLLITFIMWMVLIAIINLSLVKFHYKGWQKQMNLPPVVFLETLFKAQLVYLPNFILWIYVWYGFAQAAIISTVDPSVSAAGGFIIFAGTMLIVASFFLSGFFILASFIIYSRLKKKLISVAVTENV